MADNKADSKLGLNEIMERAKVVQKQLHDIQQKVAALQVEGQAGGGVVKIIMTGQHYAKKVTIDASLLKEDKSIIEDLIAAAINDATDKIERALRGEMGSLTGLKLPEDFGG